MKFKNNLLLGISTLTLAGFAVVGANAGSGKACSASAASDKAACAAKTTSVQTVSNEAGSCASKATAANAGSCAASHTVQTVSNEAGACGAKATSAVQTVSNDACCASKGAVQTVSNDACCASKGVVQTASVGACGVSAGACGSTAKSATASNASCSSANPSECMTAWLPEGMSFIRLDVPGGVDFVFSGKGVEKLSQACATSTAAVAEKHGSRFAMTKGDGYVVLSVRGEEAASCCGEVVETAFAGAGIRS